MLGLPIGFVAPAILFGLVALPVIWWLLRLTPPKPRAEVFPPLRILEHVARREETPARSPWWLTLLRLVMASLIILALAEPVLNPREAAVASGGPLAIIIDNSWATAPSWQERVNVAESLIDDAEQAEVPVAIVFTSSATQNATPGSPAEARERLGAAGPAPLPADRARALDALEVALGDTSPATLAFLSDGIASEDRQLEAQLAAFGANELIVFEESDASILALTDADNAAAGFHLQAARLDPTDVDRFILTAHDLRGRPIANGTLDFVAGESVGTGRIDAPFELRNDFARITVEGVGTAGTTYLLDDSFRRRRVALLSGEPMDRAQPLLSPLYYIERALEPFADLIRPEEDELSQALPDVLQNNPSVIIMADIGTFPEDVQAPVTRWIENGGTLLRFAGPRLAGAAADDPLLPVVLRRGERALGGALSWSQPQPLAPYPADSPFSGMPPPSDITVSRQVLAEPAPDLAANTWASLEDGTPLVTSRTLGDGRIILYHVTAEATWSNLPISGDFVEMLRRTILLSSATGTNTTQSPGSIGGNEETRSLPPYRLLNADGILVQPTGNARPLQLADSVSPGVSFEHPPGLYGTEDGFVAVNLMQRDDTLTPLRLALDGITITRLSYAADASYSLKPLFLGLAMLLLLIDGVIMLFMSGVFARIGRLPVRRGATAASFIGIVIGAMHLTSVPAEAADEQPGDEVFLEHLVTTRIAYVLTGEAEVDRISERGLAGLSEYLTHRTSLEPGEPAGLDLETDELAFFPLIYWPISAEAPMPSDRAISRIDAFMKNGGTVLFDTRDRFSDLGSETSPQTQRLRAVLSSLDIPPLEPVPDDHVLTKAFYLLNEFPGRYRGGEMWVEQSDDGAGEPRSVVSADGVSSVIITGNDLAGAWAVDASMSPMFPTVPSDPMQREYAYRVGVNVMMYMLTGNYKTDQVHVPALLERLGQ